MLVFAASTGRSVSRFTLGLVAAVCLQAQIINTVAGRLASSGPGSQTYLGKPGPIACDGAGNCYVADVSDAFAHLVYKVDSSGTVSHFAGVDTGIFGGDGGPARDAGLGKVTGIAIDASGNVYLAAGGRVRRVDTAGRITTVAGSGAAGSLTGSPLAISENVSTTDAAVDAAGNIYVADYLQAYIWKIDTHGYITTLAGDGVRGTSGDGGPAATARVSPSSIAIDNAGNIYFGDERRVRKITPAGFVSTVAGNGQAGLGGDGGPALAAQLPFSFRLSTDLTGNLYICDLENSRVRKVTSAGIISTIAGPGQFPLTGDGGPASAAYLTPRGLSADSSGNLYISDENGRVRKVNSAGIISTIAGTGRASPSGDGGPATVADLHKPAMIAAAAGALYVYDKGHGSVRRINSAGIISTVAGGGVLGLGPVEGGAATAATLEPLEGLAADSAGNLYISHQSTLWKVGAAGTFARIAGGGLTTWTGQTTSATSVSLSLPRSLAVDSGGNIFFRMDIRLAKVDSQGTISGVAGTMASGSGGENTPAVQAMLDGTGLCVGAQGNLYVAQRTRVRKISRAGLISTVAGSASNSGFSGDGGPALSATLSDADSLAIDASGNLFIADTGNLRVRKVDPAGIITTVAFDGSLGHAGDGGHALAAQTYSINGIAADSSGNVLISDGHRRVRKVDFSSSAVSLPTIRAMTPSVKGAGEAGFDLVLSGGSFTAQSVVRWNGANRSTTLRGDGTLQAQILATDIALAGAFSVTVFNAGAGSSNPFLFTTVGDPKPSRPSSPQPAAGTTGVTLTPRLSWVADGATKYEVYISTTPQTLGTVAATVSTPFYQSARLEASRTYYWGVVASNRSWLVASPIWSFTTGDGTAIETGLRFVPVTPCRVADTRAGQGTTGSFGPPTLPASGTRDIPIPAGRCSIPPTAKAYSLNVTAVPREPLAFLSLWPSGQARPLVSTLNSFHGGVVANAAIVPAGAGGAISVYVTNPADVIIDINGYFDSGAGSSFYTIDPCRVADTRTGSGFGGAFGPPTPAAQSTRSFPLAGSCGIPAGAGGYSINATVVPPAPLSFLSIWPTGQPQPFVSTLNSFDGAIVANAALVPAGSSGSISTYVTDRTDLIFDTNGYFGAANVPGGLLFHPLTPCRAADTRVAGSGSPIMSRGESRNFAIGGRCEVPTDAMAYSLNVTVVPAGPLSYLSLWPAGKTRPLVSTLNSFTGRVTANAALVPAGAGGAVSVFVTDDSHVILDINGYFR